MNYINALEYLESFVSYEKVPLELEKLELEKLKRFLEEYGVDYSAVKFFHVAGSKGKGTVTHLIADYLVASGKTVGLFTSPHMINVRERIWLNGADIDEVGFAGALTRFKSFYEGGWSGEKLTYFEVLFLIALEVFVSAGVEYAVLEVGLGGRLDATNIVIPEVAVITTIEKEHVAILGDTIEEIAKEKLGIAKEGVPLILGYQRQEVYALAEDASRVEDIFGAAEGAFEKNTNTAALALETVLGDLDMDLFSTVLKDFKLIGRFDIREVSGKTVIFDMAHTLDSIADLVDRLKAGYPDKGFVFLVSILKDKDVDGILELLGGCGEVVLTQSHPERSVVMGEPDCLKAFDHALKDLKKDQVLIVTGSHFLISKILPKL